MRTFIKLSKKLLVGVVSALAICMIIGSYQTVAAEKEDKYQAKNPNSLFGIAADFGIFAKKADLTAHNNSNIACDELNNGAGLDSPVTESGLGKDFFIGKHTGSNTGLQIATMRGGIKANLYIGDSMFWRNNPGAPNQRQLSREGYNFYFVGETSKLDINKKNAFIDVNNELNKLTDVAKSVMNKQAIGATGILKHGDKGFNENNRSITCTKGIENVLKVTAADLNYERPVYISNITQKDTSLIINIDTKNTKKILLTQIYFDGNSTGEYDKNAAKLIWNFGDYDGEIVVKSGYCAGTILAPKAHVRLEANLAGAVIANKFANKNAEVHFVPSFFEKEEEKTPVEVCIETVDGTCCPSLPVQGGTYALYKKQRNGKYKKVAGSEKTTEFVQDVTAVDWKKPDEASEAYNTFLASWKVEEAGEYYIKQIDKVSGAYTKTPTRCKFKVVDNDGKLELQLIKGKEANGESNKLMTFSFGDKKLAGFKLRNYQNIVSIASLNERQNTVLPVGNYSIYKCTADDVVNGTFGTKVAEAETDINGFRQVNIQELGYYCVVQEGTVDGYIIDTAPKYFVVFKSPIGHIIPVEFEDVQFGFRMVEALGGKFEIKKLTKTISENMNTVMAEYGIMADYYTDGWIVFINQPETAKKAAKINEAEAAQLLGELQQEAIEQANETVQEALDQEAQNTADVQGGQE